MKSTIENCLRKLNWGASSLQSPFLLLVRLYWGWQFIETGWGKVNNIEKVTGYFTSLGLPLPAMTAAVSLPNLSLISIIRSPPGFSVLFAWENEVSK